MTHNPSAAKLGLGVALVTRKLKLHLLETVQYAPIIVKQVVCPSPVTFEFLISLKKNI